MRCPRCQSPLVPGAAFCSQCGQPLAAPNRTNPPQPPGTQISGGYSPGTLNPAGAMAAQADQSRRQTALWVGGGLAAIVLLAIVGWRFMALRAEAASPQGALKATAEQPKGVLNVQAKAPTPVAAVEREAPAQMPDDVRAWLEHLRRTEEARVNITTGQLSAALAEKAGLSVSGGVRALQGLLNGVDDPDSQMRPPTEDLARLMKSMYDQTNQLGRDFMAVPPPAECQPIQAAYFQALNETAASMGEIGDALAAGDIQALMKMKGQSVPNIDTPGKRTDRLVGEICEKYNTPRWFSINSDITTGGVFGVGL